MLRKKFKPVSTGKASEASASSAGGGASKGKAIHRQDRKGMYRSVKTGSTSDGDSLFGSGRKRKDRESMLRTSSGSKHGTATGWKTTVSSSHPLGCKK